MNLNIFQQYVLDSLGELILKADICVTHTETGVKADVFADCKGACKIQNPVKIRGGGEFSPCCEHSYVKSHSSDGFFRIYLKQGIYKIKITDIHGGLISEQVVSVGV